MKIKKQQDQKDCGLMVIQALYYHYHHQWISLDDLKQVAHLSPQGLNIASFVELGYQFGFNMEAFEVSITDLLKESNYFVGLVKVKMQMHYVIFRFYHNMFEIWDSRLGKKKKMSIQDFSNIYGGITITVKPRKNVRKLPFNLTKEWEYLFKNSVLILWLIVILLISAVLAFSSTLFSKIIFDQVLPNFLKNTLTTLTIAFLFLALWRVINDLLKHFFTKKLVNIIEIDLTYQYLKSYSYGPIIDLEKLTFSDHLRRLNLIPSVSLFLATAIQVIFYELILLIIATAILLALAPTLFALTSALGALLVVATIICSFYLKTYYPKLLDKQQNEWQMKNEFLNSKLTLKKPIVHFFLWKKWKDQYHNFKTLDYKIWFITCVQGLVNLLSTFLLPILIIFFGLKQLFLNQLSLGSLMMFLNLTTFFINPLIRICDFLFHFKQNKANFQLLNFILQIKHQTRNNYGLNDFPIKSITLQNLLVKFDKTILTIPHYTINKSIALIGPNGAGKSVLLKTIASIYHHEGQILLNNTLIKDWNKKALTQKILWISPEEFLFSSTIWDYLTLNQATLIKNLEKNSLTHNLRPFLVSNNLDFDSPIINNGANFSAGQRQIILLCKIFSHDFDVLLLDEAFENVSSINFNWFKKTLALENKLVIEVSHSRKYLTSQKEVSIEQINTN